MPLGFCLFGVRHVACRHRRGSRYGRLHRRNALSTFFQHAFQMAHAAFQMTVAPDQRRVRIGRAANSRQRPCRRCGRSHTRLGNAGALGFVSLFLQSFQFALGAGQFICQALQFDVLLSLHFARIEIANRLAPLRRIQAFDLFASLIKFGQRHIALDHRLAHLVHQQHAADGPAQQQPENGHACQRNPHMCQQPRHHSLRS